MKSNCCVSLIFQRNFRYVNQNNFLRSVRNFKIDIRNGSPWSYLCGIHWQVSKSKVKPSNFP